MARPRDVRGAILHFGLGSAVHMLATRAGCSPLSLAYVLASYIHTHLRDTAGGSIFGRGRG